MLLRLSSIALRENGFEQVPPEYNASNQPPADERDPNTTSATALTIECHISQKSFLDQPTWRRSSKPQHVPASPFYLASPNFRNQFCLKYFDGSTGILYNTSDYEHQQAQMLCE